MNDSSKLKDLIQHHTIEAFGVTIPVRVELRPGGRPKIHDLDGPLVYTVHVQVNGAGTYYETTETGLPWVEEEARLLVAAEREYHANKRKDDA